MNGFSLAETVRTLIAEGVGPNHRDLAVKTLEAIPPGAERDVLAQLLPEYCRKFQNRDRAVVRNRAVAQALDDLEANPDSDSISLFDVVYRSEGNSFSMGDMTRADHYAVADEYRQDGEEAMFYAAVHVAIGKKCTGGKTTRDVFTEEQLRAMFQRRDGE
jgi:hypothetical protein